MVPTKPNMTKLSVLLKGKRLDMNRLDDVGEGEVPVRLASPPMSFSLTPY